MQSLVLYKSSAGSGKTYTLVLEYLRLILPEPSRFRQVLAVTFTNKATGEMKERILRSLSELAALSEAQAAAHPLHAELARELAQAGPQLQVQEQARKALSMILNDYTRFSVSTIESFFQRVLRAFARELNIPLGYEVDLDQDMALQQAIDELMLDLGRDPQLTRLLNRFLQVRLEQEQAWRLDQPLMEMGRELFKELFQNYDERFPGDANRLDAALELERQLRKRTSAFERQLLSRAEEALALMQRQGLAPEDFKYGSSGPAGYFRKVIQKREFEPGKRFLEAQEADHWVKKDSPHRKAAETALEGGLLRLARECAEIYEQDSRAYYTWKVILDQLLSAAVLFSLKYKLENYRRDNSRLIISDTSSLLNRVIRSDWETPFIYEKVGVRYQYYLLDEFQDTSDMQWRNLLPLVRESLGQGHGSLIVGDAKQSIYRWRNGNMKLLLHEVEDAVRAQGFRPELRLLNQNWRTARSLVEFNNGFFQAAAELLAQAVPPGYAEDFRLAYGDVAQQARREYPGFLSIRFFDRESRAGEEEEGGDWEAEALAHAEALIRSLLAEGFSAHEITLLVRRNSEGVRLAEFLQSRQIRVVSAESLLIRNDPGVRLLIAAFRYLAQPEEALLRAELSAAYLQQAQGAAPDHASLGAAEGVALVEAMRAELAALSLYEALETLASALPGYEQPDAYLQGLRDAVLEYARGFDGSVGGFLEWWEQQAGSRSIVAAPDSDSVQIMTIHKSKGLEFPVVILPFCHWELASSRQGGRLWLALSDPLFRDFPFVPVAASSRLKQTLFEAEYEEERSKQLLDSLNLLYVALTRPEFRLYLGCARKKLAAKAERPRLGDVADLLTETLLGGDWSRQEFTAGDALSRDALRALGAKDAAPARQGAALAPNPGGFARWNERLRIRLDAARWSQELPAIRQKAAYGERIHAALALMRLPSELRPALDRLLHQGVLQPEEYAPVEQALLSLLARPEAARWFAPEAEIRMEAAIVLAGGEVLRPDRVGIEGKAAWVLDYKTGQPSPAHLRQVQRYMMALADMGYAPVEGFLYYLGSGETVEVKR